MDSKAETAVAPTRATAVAAYLNTLHTQLVGLPLEKQQEVREEVLQHIEALEEADILLGGTPEEAIAAALRQFGDPRKIGRQIAREWQLREWRRGGIILLKAFVAPVSYVGIAALWTTVMAVTSLMADGTTEDYALWLQRTYWLIGLEACIKMMQAAFTITGGAAPTLASPGYSPAHRPIAPPNPERRCLRLNLASLRPTLKTLLRPMNWLSLAAFSTIILAISSSVLGWPDEDYAFWLYRTGWFIGLDAFIKWMQEGTEPFIAKRKAKLKIFVERIQPSASIISRALGVTTKSASGPLDETMADHRSLPLNLACFVFPPLGLLSWLVLDGRSPGKARSAGRSAVRGTIVAIIACMFLSAWFLVNNAIFAIGKARLQPINPHLPMHSLRHHRKTTKFISLALPQPR
ncbi:MAG: hypothetical protein JO316_08940 [Abitibacteriaceae bacterium]|nr:hypothetical protein [Abditibacteriaceae bacterium]